MIDEIVYLKVGNENLPLIFNCNVVSELQNKYGSLKKWQDLVKQNEYGEPNFDAIKFFIKIAINEAIDIENENCLDNKNNKRDFITEKQAGRLLTTIGDSETMKVLSEAIKKGTPKNKRKNEFATKSTTN